MHPKISIIVPCYKVEKYLDRCVKSLIHQTLDDIEIILVDDCSPDRVPQMCDDWTVRDSRIKVIHKDHNEGLGFACNTGIESASGEYLAFCDSDDWVDSSMYEDMYSVAHRNNVRMVFTGLKRVDEKGRVTPMTHFSNDALIAGRSEIDSFLLEMIASKPYDPIERHIQMSAKVVLYSREMLNENHLRFESERNIISEDLFFNINCLKHADGVYVLSKTYYNYFCNRQSITHNFKLEKFEAYKKLHTLLSGKVFHIDGGQLRVDRFFIGYVRTHYLQLAKSNIKNKRIAFSEIIEDDIWNDIKLRYKPKYLNVYARVFYILTIFHLISFLIYYCNIINFITHK